MIEAAPADQFTPALQGDSGLEIWTGGPVEPQRGALLLPEEPLGDDAFQVSPGVYVSSSAELLRKLIELNNAPREKQIQQNSDHRGSKVVRAPSGYAVPGADSRAPLTHLG